MDKDFLKKFPDRPGVYLFRDSKGVVIYVGKAKSLRKRVSSYFRQPQTSAKTGALLKSFSTIEYIETERELDALLLENQKIKELQPKYNVQMKDDKSYPYIKLSINEKWPRIFSVRKKEYDGALYFGPYEGGTVRETLQLIKRLFPLRTCKETPMKMREAPCLSFHIKRCLGPCINAVAHDEYMKVAWAVVELLNGNMGKAIDNLKMAMEQASKEKRYEDAGRIRDKLKKIEGVVPNVGVVNVGTRLIASLHLDSDAILQRIQNLQDILKLKNPPNRIECFDISNLGRESTVASMVVFVDGEPYKSDYRKFIIRGIVQDDFASMYQVIKRRYSGTLSKKMPLPELIVVDGGEGQVRMAKKALDECNIAIPLIGLAKREEELYFPNKKETLKIDKNSKGILLLRTIRDEAHRFAVAFHRKRRGSKF